MLCELQTVIPSNLIHLVATITHECILISEILTKKSDNRLFSFLFEFMENIFSVFKKGFSNQSVSLAACVLHNHLVVKG